MRPQFRGRIAVKCASAFAAMAVIVLGTPAIAMAGTIGSVPGPGRPVQVQIVCPRLPGKFVRNVRLPLPGKPVSIERIKLRGKQVKIQRINIKLHGLPPRSRLRLACPFPKACPPGILSFDMAPGSSTLTEVSGPVLAPTQEFSYQGQMYTIMSVNPGADSFTVFRDGVLFVNGGPAITRGIGMMGCNHGPFGKKDLT
jgi:hypothetical protein